jgi:Na+/alanine symporter
MGVGSIAGGAMYYLDPDMAWIATVVLFASSVVCYYLVLKKQALGDELSA